MPRFTQYVIDYFVFTFWIVFIGTLFVIFIDP